MCWQKGYGEPRQWQTCHLLLGKQIYLTCTLPLQAQAKSPALQSQLWHHFPREAFPHHPLRETTIHTLLLILYLGCLLISFLALMMNCSYFYLSVKLFLVCLPHWNACSMRSGSKLTNAHLVKFQHISTCLLYKLKMW